jgi:predicted nucleotidyltransferase
MISRRSIKKFAKEVARRFKPRKIILFGSYAYGRPTQDSDVDLLVVMSGKGRPQDKALRIRMAVEADFPMDLIVHTPAEIQKRIAWGDSFLREIAEKGISLYEACRQVRHTVRSSLGLK